MGDYDRFKAWCDDYFFLPHRGETRGVGGVFFDYLGAKGEHAPEDVFAFVQDLGRAFTTAYLPIVERRHQPEPYGEAERNWQLVRRGRYVEFNLIYDRGTLFGLKTNGRVESILMSLPPLVRWDYDVMAKPGSREAEARFAPAVRPTGSAEKRASGFGPRASTEVTRVHGDVRRKLSGLLGGPRPEARGLLLLIFFGSSL